MTQIQFNYNDPSKQKIKFIYTVEEEKSHFPAEELKSIPYIICKKIYKAMSLYSRQLMPQDRRVFLTMKDYAYSDVYVQKRRMKQKPTRVIVFCVRFVRTGIFQPIGTVCFAETNLVADQYKTLSEFIKTYVMTLTKMGLYVIASLSPSSYLFKTILSHCELVPPSEVAGAMVYTVGDLRIIHMYDMNTIISDMLEVFKTHSTKFVYDGQLHVASSIYFSCMGYDERKPSDRNAKTSYRRHIFTSGMVAALLDFAEIETDNKNLKSTIMFVDMFRTIFRLFDIEAVIPKHVLQCCKTWEDSIEAIQTLEFKMEGSAPFKNPYQIPVHKNATATIRKAPPILDREKFSKKKKATLYKPLPVAADFLHFVNGMQEVCRTLLKQNISQFQMNSFNLKHIDNFIDLINFDDRKDDIKKIDCNVVESSLAFSAFVNTNKNGASYILK